MNRLTLSIVPILVRSAGGIIAGYGRILAERQLKLDGGFACRP